MVMLTIDIEVSFMVNKYSVKRKQYERLGIRKNKSGDFDYINPDEKNKSKYESIERYSKNKI